MGESYHGEGVMTHEAHPTSFTIRKDGLTPSRPWAADIKWSDGSIWKSWRFVTMKLEVVHEEKWVETDREGPV